jgi:hypothetical protein
MHRMAEPIISGRFARLLIALGSLITSAPFLSQHDWRGWLASFITIVAVATIAWLVLSSTAERVRDWREGDFD